MTSNTHLPRPRAALVPANELTRALAAAESRRKFLGRRFLDFSAGASYIAPDIDPLFMTSPFALFIMRDAGRGGAGHGRPSPVKEHHAPKGAAGCGEIQAVRKARAGNHRLGQKGAARPRHEPAPARGRLRRPRRE